MNELITQLTRYKLNDISLETVESFLSDILAHRPIVDEVLCCTLRQLYNENILDLQTCNRLIEHVQSQQTLVAEVYTPALVPLLQSMVTDSVSFELLSEVLHSDINQRPELKVKYLDVLSTLAQTAPKIAKTCQGLCSEIEQYYQVDQEEERFKGAKSIGVDQPPIAKNSIETEQLDTIAIVSKETETVRQRLNAATEKDKTINDAQISQIAAQNDKTESSQPKSLKEIIKQQNQSSLADDIQNTKTINRKKQSLIFRVEYFARAAILSVSVFVLGYGIWSYNLQQSAERFANLLVAPASVKHDQISQQITELLQSSQSRQQRYFGALGAEIELKIYLKRRIAELVYNSAFDDALTVAKWYQQIFQQSQQIELVHEQIHKLLAEFDDSFRQLLGSHIQLATKIHELKPKWKRFSLLKPEYMTQNAQLFGLTIELKAREYIKQHREKEAADLIDDAVTLFADQEQFAASEKRLMAIKLSIDLERSLNEKAIKQLEDDLAQLNVSSTLEQYDSKLAAISRLKQLTADSDTLWAVIGNLHQILTYEINQLNENNKALEAKALLKRFEPILSRGQKLNFERAILAAQLRVNDSLIEQLNHTKAKTSVYLTQIDQNLEQWFKAPNPLTGVANLLAQVNDYGLLTGKQLKNHHSRISEHLLQYAITESQQRRFEPALKALTMTKLFSSDSTKITQLNRSILEQQHSYSHDRELRHKNLTVQSLLNSVNLQLNAKNFVKSQKLLLRLAQYHQNTEIDTEIRNQIKDKIIGYFQQSIARQDVVTAEQWLRLAGDINESSPQIKAQLLELKLTANDAQQSSAAINRYERINQSDKPCQSSLSFCYDQITESVKGPLLVVLPKLESAHFAITRYEITIEDFNQYCIDTGECKKNETTSSFLPVTNIPLWQMQSYGDWLSAMTGQNYQLPTFQQWQFAAQSQDWQPKTSRTQYQNCQIAVKGELLQGFELRPVNYNVERASNFNGLVHALGNAREVVKFDKGWLAAGGSWHDDIDNCRLNNRTAYQGQADRLTGFRLVRAVGGGG